MTKIIAVIASMLLVTSAFAAGVDQIALIPRPQKLQVEEGTFRLKPNTIIVADAGARKTAEQLAQRLRSSTGYTFEVHQADSPATTMPSCIFLTTRHADPKLNPEGYDLIIAPASVTLRAPRDAGLFYAVQTLLQLLPPKIFSNKPITRVSWQAPCVRIEDWPRFPWRGLMLDVSRHFYTPTDVEHVLDLMALYKLNRLQLHLTDFQGWRIEVPQYPKLTRIGAWRKESRIETPSPQGANAQPEWMKPAADKFAPDGRYGGYYTPEDIRHIVAYAAARHITIVPEIEMPGHAGAALNAYPDLNCITSDGTPASNTGVYCAGNDQTFHFLETVLKEVCRLFPGKYVHIGGDEVNPANWEHCPRCQARMKAEGLANAAQLEGYFIRRIDTFVHAQGKTLVGWSEIARDGLAPNAVLMDWIGGAKQAAAQGHDVVMTPVNYCYFDHYQSTDHATEPQAIGGYLPLKQVYSFDPIPAGLPSQLDSHILGGQANLWTEYIASAPHVEYMLFPRLCALAEMVWSPKDGRDWAGFQHRLQVDEQRLDELGINYRRQHIQ